MTLDSSQNKIVQSEVNASDYQVVSKPSIANKAECNEENMRQSVIDRKLSLKKKPNEIKKGGIDSGTNGTAASSEAVERLQEENKRLLEFKDKLTKSKAEN